MDQSDAADNTTLKRKRVDLTLSKKVELLTKLENGVKVRDICAFYNVGSATVYEMKKNKVKLLQNFKDNYTSQAMAKRYRLYCTKSADLDKILFEWFKQQKADGVSVSSQQICDKAKEIHDKLQLIENCSYSKGWLTRFKKRHGIKLSMLPEDLVPSLAIQTWPNLSSTSKTDMAEEIIAEWPERENPIKSEVFDSEISSTAVTRENNEDSTETSLVGDIVDVKHLSFESNWDRAEFINEDNTDSVGSQESSNLDVSIKLAEKLITHLEQESFISPQDMLSIYKIKDKLMKERLKQLKGSELGGGLEIFGQS